MSGIDTISTESARIIREREEKIREVFGELQKTRRELSLASDRSDYQTSRIEMLEREISSLRTTVASLETSLREVTTKNLNKNEKISLRREKT